MKKVGLCVCQETKNYGSQLQVLATEVAVQKLGYEYEIIRYKKKYDLKFVIKSIPRLFDPLLMKGKISSYFLNKRIKKYPDIYEKCKERNRIFDKFAERYFTNLSPIYYGYDALKDGTKGYDTFLVGSDQLWLPSGLATGFYNLQFAPDEKLKIAYATSFGVSQIPWYQIGRTRKYLRRINYLSTRELKGKEIIKKIDMLSLKMIEDIKTIVKMPSVEGTFQQGAPFGKDIALTLDKVLEIAQSLGFETKNLDHYIGYAQYGKGEDYIGIIGHLDVVPTGLGWKHPPFSAYEEDGYIYSRGILDNKGPIMTCLYALYAIKELNIKLHKPVRIIFGCDEETGFKDLEYYLKHEKPPVMGWTPDCKYPVVYAERGRAVIEISAKEKQVDEFFLFINNYFLNANTNAEKLGLDFKDEEFGINEMRNFVLKHEKSKLVFSVTFSYPANMTLETIVETIREKAKNMEVTCVQHYFPVKFEKDCPMVSLLSKAYEKITHLDGTPVTTTGGTYAKLMPHIVPFGPSFPGQKGIGHQPNEWMKIEDLNTNAKIYALGIYYLGML